MRVICLAMLIRDVNDFDVAVLWDNGIDRYWISYFDLLSTAVEDEYLRRGISIDELTISQSTRLAEPVTWWGGRNDDDWVLLLTPYQIPPSAAGFNYIMAICTMIGC